MCRFAVLAACSAWAGVLVQAAVPDRVIAPGVRMPMLGFGTWAGSLSTCDVQEAVEQFLELGGRHLDCAHDYGSQPDVGRALKASAVPREELFVTTKVPGPIGREAVVEMVKRHSLPELGLDYIDLLLIHYPWTDGNCSDTPGEAHREERLATFQGLLDLQEAGLIRAAGVSNFNAEHVNEIINAGLGRPAVNQVEMHLGYHNATFLEAMNSAHVIVEAYAPLGGSIETQTHPGISLSDPRLKSIASRYNVSTAAVALNWLGRKGVAPVTASCSAAHVAGDLAVFDLVLTDEDSATLDALKVSEGAGSLVVV